MPEKKPKPISFTQYEKTCKFHVKGEDKICYCSDTEDVCNKENCPKFGHKLEEEEEY
jgi:hypothetical protein